jgi:zinc-ribbon domain
MSASGWTCPSCGAPVSAGHKFCPNCGVLLPAATGPLPLAGPPAFGGGTWGGVGLGEPAVVPKGQDQTKTGLLLIAIAFGLLWIPYVSGVGGLLALIGILLLWLGRKGFGPNHRRNVLVGGTCVLLSFLTGIVVAAWFIDALLTQTPPGETSRMVSSAFQSDLGVVFLVGVAASILSAVAYVSLPFALADPTSRYLLVTAGVLTVVISAVTTSLLYPQIAGAVAQATAGSTINSAPITALEQRSYFLSTAQILPDMLFLWAYYRTRRRVFPDHPPSTPRAGPGDGYGRPS